MDSASYTTMCTTMESYLQQYRKNHISYMMLTGNGFAAKTYIPISQRLPDEVIRDLEDIAGATAAVLSGLPNTHSPMAFFLVRQVRRISNARLDPLAYLIINIDVERLLNDCCHFPISTARLPISSQTAPPFSKAACPLPKKIPNAFFPVPGNPI